MNSVVETNEIALAGQAEPTSQRQLSVVEYAVQSGASVADVRALLELQIQADNHKLAMLKAKAEMDREDRVEASVRAFAEAFAAFKAEAVQIIKTKEIKDGPLKGKKHAELGIIVDAVTPALSKHGLSTSWKITKDAPDWLEVTCTLRHVGGYSESIAQGGPPDAGPGRNAIQARSSTNTYLERLTTLSILGLAAKDQDDDGAGGAALSALAAARVDELVALATAAATREAAMAVWTEHNAELAALPEQHARLKKAVADRRAALKGAAK